MSYTPLNYAVATAPTLTTVQDHYAGIDTILGDVRREVRLTGGITNLTLANHSNALIILTAGVNQLTSSGVNTFPCTIWNRSGSDADILGVTLPNNEIGMTIIDGANNIAEVSQTFSGVTSVTASLPMSSTGGTTPNLSILTNAANGVPQLDALGRYPAFDGSQITNIAATGFPVADNVGIFQGSADATKAMVFELDGNTAGTTRTLTAPDEDIDLGHVADIRRVVRVAGGALALTLADHSNALIIITGGTQTFTSSGAGVFPVTIWNQSANAATVIGTSLPANAIAIAIIDAGNNIVEVSQTVSPLASLTVNAPITDAGTATDPNLSLTTNVAGGVALFDGAGRYPALDGSLITNVAPGPFQDTSVVVQDSIDNTKQIMFEAGAIATGNTRIINMPNEDVDLGLVKEVDREFTFSANATLTVADHRNALIICDTAGITLTMPTVGNLYFTGINVSAGTVTVGGTVVGSMQLFTGVTVGAVAVIKAST